MSDPNYSMQYDSTAKRWYRTYYNQNTQQWDFVNWLEAQTPTVVRHDSGVIHHPQHSYASASTAGPAYPQNDGRSREGHTVRGNYDSSNPNPTPDALHYEHLDNSFYVRESNFFQDGRLFSVLFTEPAGTNAVIAHGMNAITDYNTAFSLVRYNEYVHTQVRRFIVVKRKREFCYAVPIFTYSGQGTKKSGVAPQEHAIAYSYGSTPQLLTGEVKLTKDAICIVMNPGERPLSQASRIYFGIQHPIQYNVKVKDLGYVHPQWMPSFLGYHAMENGNDTQQATEVTDEAGHAVDD